MTQTAFAPPPGLISEDTVFAAPGRWANGSLARFYQGGWQVKGGWERLTLENLGGVCRAVLGWTDTVNVQDVAFGLHNGLKVWQGGLVFDITPLAFPPVTLGSNPFATVNTGAAVTVTQIAHGYSAGQTVLISGAPLTNGIPAASLNGLRVIGSVSADAWVFTAGTVATSTAPGGGAGIVVQNQLPFQPGQIDGTGGAGYGTGTYGTGTYGTPSAAEYFPLTWSLANWGGDLLANPRGRTIYRWNQVVPGTAVALAGAPANVTYMVVTPSRQVMALGCNQEVGGVFNPLCIRWSDIEDFNDWTSAANNNAGEWILESGGRIVCGRVVGDYVFVWTTAALFLGTFIGAPGQTWKFERIGANCGAISPGAPVVATQNVAWISPDKVFWTCSLGGAPKQIPCPIRAMFADHITAGQQEKIVGGTVSTFSELTWSWPDDRDGFECSRLLSLGPDGWSRDLLARSAYVDAGPQVYPIGVAPTGAAYWHEKGASADGAPLVGFIESTDFYLDEAEGGMLVNGIYPDFRSQVGSMALTLYVREFPQSTQRAHGPWSLAPGQQKRSFRLSGRIARVRWDWASAPAFARGGKPEFDVQPIGGR